MKHGTVLVPGLNLHKTINGATVDKLAKGDRLLIVDTPKKTGKLQWLYVEHYGVRGYVAQHGPDGTAFVEIDKDEPLPEPIDPPTLEVHPWVHVVAAAGGFVIAALIVFLAYLTF